MPEPEVAATSPGAAPSPIASPSPAVAVRAAEPGDFEAVARIYRDPRVVWGTLQLPFPSAERWRKRLAEPREGVYSLVASADGEVVGLLTLEAVGNPRRRHVGQIAMAVRDDWQGRGVGTALMEAAVDLADNWLDLSRIELDVYTDNEPGIRLYQRFGFATEGTLRRFAFRDGRYVDVFAMARLRSADA